MSFDEIVAYFWFGLALVGLSLGSCGGKITIPSHSFAIPFSDFYVQQIAIDPYARNHHSRIVMQ